MYFNYFFFQPGKAIMKTGKSFNYSTGNSAQYLALIAFKQVHHLSTWKCFFFKSAPAKSISVYAVTYTVSLWHFTGLTGVENIPVRKLNKGVFF